MDKVILNESEQRQVDLITEEFKARGGMSTEELISRLNAIPFEEFMNKMSEKSGTDGNDLCILCTLHSIFLKFCALCFIANPATRKLVAWFSCKFGNEKRLFVRF